MRSFTFHFDSIKISVIYDAINIYPNPCLLDLDKWIKVVEACDKISTYHPVNNREGRLLTKARSQLTTDVDFDEYIASDDPQHPLFHTDGYNRKELHYHFKTCTSITIEKLTKILDVFMEFELINEMEKSQCMKGYEHHFDEYFIQLNGLLSHDKYNDTKEIICFIYKCRNNDFLANLHKQLQHTDYDYLRELTKWPKISFWQGISKDGLATTSRSWTSIEKSIMLQMSYNIIHYAHQFTEEISQKRSKSFSEEHEFFSIKRHSFLLDRTGKNDSFKYFSSQNKTEFLKKYKAHFGDVERFGANDEEYATNNTFVS